MNTFAIRSALVRALGVALALAPGSAITDLGTLGGDFSQGSFENALNDAGQVTGSSTTPAVQLTPFCGAAPRCGTSARWGARRATAEALTPRGR